MKMYSVRWDGMRCERRGNGLEWNGIKSEGGEKEERKRVDFESN
jgi:hypothetical protein